MRDQAHPIVSAPSNLRRGPIPPASEWDRRDPGYDVHRPLSHDDLAALVRMIPAAVVFLAGLLAVLGLIIAIVPGPVPA